MSISDIKVLLISNNDSSTNASKSILEELGVFSVNIAKTYKDAVSVISHDNINIIIIGSCISGEINSIKSIQNLKEDGGFSLSVIFQPDDFDKDLMLSVMEHDPDDVIAASDDETLKERYLKNIKNYIETKEVRRKLDNNDLSSASALCSQMIQRNFPSKVWCIRKKLEIYMMQNNFASLEDYSRFLLKDMNLEFIRVYLAKSLFEQKHYEDAISESGQAISMFPMSSKSYMIKGDSHVSLGQYEEAIECFKMSSSLTPFSFAAKKKLTDAHEENENYVESKNGYLSLLDMAENTPEDEPKLYGGLITVTNKKLIKDGEAHPEFKDNGEKLVLKMTHKFPESEFVAVSSMMFLAQVEYHNGRIDASQKIIENIRDNYVHVYITDQKVLFNLILTCFSVDDFDTASALAESYAHSFPGGNDVSFINKQNEIRKDKENLKKSAFCNIKGREAFDQKDFDTAMKYLKISLRLTPNYPVYYANLIKIIISKIKHDGLDYSLVNEANDCINKIQSIISKSGELVEVKSLKKSLDDVILNKKNERDHLINNAFSQARKEKLAS